MLLRWKYTLPWAKQWSRKSSSSRVIALLATPVLCSLWELAWELSAFFLLLYYKGMPTFVKLPAPSKAMLSMPLFTRRLNFTGNCQLRTDSSNHYLFQTIHPSDKPMGIPTITEGQWGKSFHLETLDFLVFIVWVPEKAVYSNWWALLHFFYCQV